MLVLPITKTWLDMIISRKKKEEYREIKQYYDVRFQKYFYNNKIRINKNLVDKEVIFRNGYNKTSPQVKCLVHLDKGKGKQEWGARPNEEYYILKFELDFQIFKLINNKFKF